MPYRHRHDMKCAGMTFITLLVDVRSIGMFSNHNIYIMIKYLCGSCAKPTSYVQVYSDKTNCNRNTDLYPVKLGLLNVKYAERIKRLSTVAYIPILSKPPGMDDQTFRACKRQFLALALQVILADLREASFTGVLVETSDGFLHTVFPRLLSYVADDPEQRQVLQIYSANSAHRPCVRCFCVSSCLCELHLSYAARTLTKQKQIQDSISGATLEAEALSTSQLFSTHAEAIGIAGFAGEEFPECKHNLCSLYHIYLLGSF